MYTLLPGKFQPKICDRLCRFGGDHDGGYLVTLSQYMRRMRWSL